MRLLITACALSCLSANLLPCEPVECTVQELEEGRGRRSNALSTLLSSLLPTCGRIDSAECLALQQTIKHVWRVREARNSVLASAPTPDEHIVQALGSAHWAGDATWTWATASLLRKQPVVMLMDAASADRSVPSTESSKSEAISTQLSQLISLCADAPCRLRTLLSEAENGNPELLTALEQLPFPGIVLGDRITAAQQQGKTLDAFPLLQAHLTASPYIEVVRITDSSMKPFKQAEYGASSLLIALTSDVWVDLMAFATHTALDTGISTTADTEEEHEPHMLLHTHGVVVNSAQSQQKMVLGAVKRTSKTQLDITAAYCTEETCKPNKLQCWSKQTSNCTDLDVLPGLTHRYRAKLRVGNALYVPSGFIYAVTPIETDAAVLTHTMFDDIALENMRYTVKFHPDSRVAPVLAELNALSREPLEYPRIVHITANGFSSRAASSSDASSIQTLMEQRSRRSRLSTLVGATQHAYRRLDVYSANTDIPQIIHSTPTTLTLAGVQTQSATAVIAIQTDCHSEWDGVFEPVSSVLLRQANTISALMGEKNLADSLDKSIQAQDAGTNDMAAQVTQGDAEIVLEVGKGGDVSKLLLDGSQRWIDELLERNSTEGGDKMVLWHENTLQLELALTASWLRNRSIAVLQCGENKNYDAFAASQQVMALLDEGVPSATTIALKESVYLDSAAIDAAAITQFNGVTTNWAANANAPDGVYVRELLPQECPASPLAVENKCSVVVDLPPNSAYTLRVLFDDRVGAATEAAWTQHSTAIQQQSGVFDVTGYYVTDSSIIVSWNVYNTSDMEAVLPMLGFLIEAALPTQPHVFEAAVVVPGVRFRKGWTAKLNNVSPDSVIVRVRAINAAGIVGAAGISEVIAFTRKGDAPPTLSTAFIAPSGEAFPAVPKTWSNFTLVGDFSARSYPPKPVPRMLAALITQHAAAAIAYTALKRENPHLPITPSAFLARSGLGFGVLQDILAHTSWVREGVLPSHFSAAYGSRFGERGLKQVLLLLSDVLNSTAVLDREKQVFFDAVTPCADHLLLAGVGGLANFAIARESRMRLLARFIAAANASEAPQWAAAGLRWLHGSGIDYNATTVCGKNAWITAYYTALAKGAMHTFMHRLVDVFGGLAERVTPPEQVINGSVWCSLQQADAEIHCYNAAAEQHADSSSSSSSHAGGKRVPAWFSAFSSHKHVNASVVSVVPATAAVKKLPHLHNANEMHGKIAMVERGDISIASKVQLLADAGAVGVIIIDDARNRCGFSGFSDKCVAGSSLLRGEGFGHADAPSAWQFATIPAALVSREAGLALQRYVSV